MPDSHSESDAYHAALARRDTAIEQMEQLCVSAISRLIRVPIQASAIAGSSGLRVEIRFRAGTPLATVIDLGDLAQAAPPYADPVVRLFALASESDPVQEVATELLLHLRRLAEDLKSLGSRLRRFDPESATSTP